MGFPDSYALPTDAPAGPKDAVGPTYKQLGNAVCPPVIQAIASAMLPVLGLEPPPRRARKAGTAGAAGAAAKTAGDAPAAPAAPAAATGLRFA